MCFDFSKLTQLFNNSFFGNKKNVIFTSNYKMMLKILYLFVFIAISVASFAQEEKYFINPDDSSSYFSEKNIEKTPFTKSKKMEFRLNTGTSFTNMYGNGLFSSYVAPQVKYNFNQKFSLSVGTMMTVNTFPKGLPSWSDANNSKGNVMASYYMFAKGEYIVTDNFKVRAATLFDVTPASNQNRVNYSSLGFDYKIGENACISADFNFYNGNQNNQLFDNPINGYFNNYHIRPYGNFEQSDPFTSW
jgi:hypothetical protein